MSLARTSACDAPPVVGAGCAADATGIRGIAGTDDPVPVVPEIPVWAGGVGATDGEAAWVPDARACMYAATLRSVL